MAQTLEALTATAPTTAAPTPVPANGLPVSYNNISFTIPLELNTNATPSTNTDVEFPYINPSNGPMPEHVVFQFTNYPVQGDVKIMVFKASDYAAYGEPLQKAVTALLSGQDTAQPLPDTLTQGDFFAQVKPVSFKNGHGVRYLTQALTGIAPINNEELFYYYQGIARRRIFRIRHLSRQLCVPGPKQQPGCRHSAGGCGDGSNLDFPAYLNAVIDSSEPMLLQADEMVYDNDNSKVTAKGNVEIYYGNYTLLADRVVYDRNANTLAAEGNVRIKDPDGAVITSDQITLTDDFRDGFIDALKLVTKDDTRIVASSATRQAGNVTVFEKAWFTPCKVCADNPSKPPTWRIRAGKITHKRDQATITYKNVVFDFLGVPVLLDAPISRWPIRP